LTKLDKYTHSSLLSFVVIFSAYFLFDTVRTYEELGFNISVGSYLYLPLGGYLFSWLVFRHYGFLGMLIASVLFGIYYSLGKDVFLSFTIINVITAPATTLIFSLLGISIHKKILNIQLGRILLLCVFVSLLNTIFKYTYLFSQNAFENSAEMESAYVFITTYFPGDVLGSFSYMLFLIVIIKIFHLER